jgi:MHS family citrate/tricarballylate:H+ symporter-like MFS transporter
MVVWLTEIMPAEVRASGFSMAYSLATALFGGFTPYISTWLIDQTHNRAVPGAWVALAAAMGLVATWIIGQRAGSRVELAVEIA